MRLLLRLHGAGPSWIALRFILTVVRELDVRRSAVTRRVAGFVAGSHITHVQNCTNLHCLQQMTDLHRSLGTPQGWITVQRGWSPPRCCCWRGERCGYPMMMVLTVHYPNIPFYSILFYSLLSCMCWYCSTPIYLRSYSYSTRSYGTGYR